MKFTCPKCKGALAVEPLGRAVCPLSHSYDRSREGYYNLLLSNVGGVHGDNREMMTARRAFLDTGAYLSLDRAHFFADFYSQAASYIYAQSIEAYLPDVTVKSKYDSDLVVSRPYNYQLSVKFG